MARNWNETELFKYMTELVAETTIGRREVGEDAKTFQVKFADLPLVAIDRIIRYGTQRFINDKLGGSDKTLAMKCEMASDIIVELYNGTVSKRREAVPADPMSKFRIEALKEIAGDSWAKINKLENKGEIIAAALVKHAERIEPRAMELKALDDKKREGAAKIAAKLNLADFGL